MVLFLGPKYSAKGLLVVLIIPPQYRDEDHASRLAEEHTGDRDPITAPETSDNDEPLQVSLDSDADDRMLDRQFAHVLLLDDAAPLFREDPASGCRSAVGSSVSGRERAAGCFGSTAKSSVRSDRPSTTCARACSRLCSWRCYVESRWQRHWIDRTTPQRARTAG